jgi:hypothetical protein
MVNILFSTFFIVFMCWCSQLSAHQHAAIKKEKNLHTLCNVQKIACAKTVTVAAHPNGDLWRVWTHKNHMFYAVSHNQGAQFNKRVKIKGIDEPISSRGENRPKIAFGQNGFVYLSWAMPKEKKYTADIRFSYSKNNGLHFSKPITVNNDGLLTGHSFNEILVTENNQPIITWLDGRDKFKATLAGEKTNGSALYLAKGALNADGSMHFTNRQLANGTCVCCRIAMVQTGKDKVSIMWRHIFGDNIRDFSLLTYDFKDKNIINQNRVTFDDWYINGCPHQGAAIDIDDQQRLHLTWFNQGQKGKGLFYAYSDNLGQTRSKPVSIGNLSQQAMHANVKTNGKNVNLVWIEFNGKAHELWHQKSINSGASFLKPKIMARSKTGADRPFIISDGLGNHYVSWQRPKTGHWIEKL